MHSHVPDTPRGPSLPLFTCLEVPYGIGNVVSIVVPMYLLRNAGYSIAQVTALSSLCLIPSTFYFLYAPITDFFFGRRTWYLIAMGLTAVLGAAAVLSSGSHRLGLVTCILFLYTACTMLISAATGGLMSTVLHKSGQNRVGTWVQLGNQALGGAAYGLVIFLTTRCSLPTLALITIALTLPGLAVLKLREPARETVPEPFSATLRTFGEELIAMLRSRKNLPCTLLMLSPLSALGFSNIVTGLAPNYGATAEQLAFANGWGGALFIALGALLLLLVPARWHRMVPYLGGGLLSAAVSFAIALSPLTPRAFIAGVLACNFATGVCYSAATGMVLYVPGRGGRRHGTRYALINSMVNVSLTYMIALEGAVAQHYGPRMAAAVDGALGSGMVALAVAVYLVTRARQKDSAGEQFVPA